MFDLNSLYTHTRTSDRTGSNKNQTMCSNYKSVTIISMEIWMTKILMRNLDEKFDIFTNFKIFFR